jgi:hypothetical protein
MNDSRELGQVAFEAYKQFVQGQTYDAKPIPEWDDLGPKIKDAWRVAAVAVLRKNTSELCDSHTRWLESKFKGAA